MSEVMYLSEYSKQVTGRSSALAIWALVRQYDIRPLDPFYTNDITEILELPRARAREEMRILREVGAIARLGEEYEVEYVQEGKLPDWHVRVNRAWWNAQNPAIDYALRHYDDYTLVA